MAVGDRLEAAVSTAVGLSPAAVAALLWIERAPGVRRRDLAKALRITQPTVTRLVATLEEKGLVLREGERDRRAERLRPSELGTRRARDAILARAHLTKSLVERLPTVLRPRMIRIAELLLGALLEQPRAALRGCRFCDWNLCRSDATAPCPLVAAEAARRGSSRELALEGPRIHEDRRTIFGRDPPFELWLEPGGIGFKLEPHRRLEVICRGLEPGRVQLERLPEGHLALYAWERALFTVLEAGREIFVQERWMSLVDLAPGTTPRERVEAMLGHFARRRQTPPSRWL